MEELFGALTGGTDDDSDEEQEGTDPLSSLLAGLASGESGGLADLPGSVEDGGTTGASGGLADLLGALEEGGEPGASGGMADLLGSLAGGGAAGAPGGMEDLLGSVLGGGQSSTGGMGGLLGALGAGGGTSMAGGADAFLAPMVQGIADKLGLPPEIVQSAVSLVLGKLLSGKRGPGDPEGLELAQIMGQDGASVDTEALRASGLVKELSDQTGVDADTAEATLQEVFNLMGDSGAR